jgi:hypothetical protein
MAHPLLATTVPATARRLEHTIAATETVTERAIVRADIVPGMDASLGLRCRMVAASRIADIRASFH